MPSNGDTEPYKGDGWPFYLSKALLIATVPPHSLDCQGSHGSPKKGPKKRTRIRVRNPLWLGVNSKVLCLNPGLVTEESLV